MATTALVDVQIRSDYDCNGGTLLATVTRFAKAGSVGATDSIADGQRFAFGVPADDASALVLRPRCVARRAYADGTVREGRLRREQRSDSPEEGVVVQVTFGCPLDDLSDAGPVSDWVGTEPLFAGTMIQATIPEWWSLIAATTLARSGVAGLTLDPSVDSTTRYDWKWDGQSIDQVIRAITKREMWTTRNGTTDHRVFVGTRGAGTPTVVVAPDGNGLRRIERGYTVDQQASAVLPRTASGRGIGEQEFHVTAAGTSTTRTLTLTDPEGVTAPIGVTNDLVGLSVRRLATNRHYLIAAADPATQTLTLHASTGWPADPWVTSGIGRDRIDIRATAPSLSAPTDPLVRPWAGGLGVDWAIGTVTSGPPSTVALTARSGAPATFRGAVGDLASLRNVQLRTATLLHTITTTLGISSSQQQIFGPSAWVPSDMQPGDLLIPDPGGLMPTTPLLVVNVAGDLKSVIVRALWPMDVLTWPLWITDDGSPDGAPQDGTYAMTLRHARLSSVAIPIVSCATGSDTLTIEGTTGLAVGAYAFFAAPAVGQAQTALVDPAAIAQYGRKTMTAPIADGIRPRSARRNLHGDGWFTQYSGTTVPDGWTAVAGTFAKSTAAGTTRYGGASMQFPNGGGTVRSRIMRTWWGPDVTQIAARIPVCWIVPNYSGGLRPIGTVRLLDRTGGQTTPIATLTIPQGAIPPNAWDDIVFLNAPIPTGVVDVQFELTITSGYGAFYVDGLQVTGTADAPEGLIAWSDANAVVQGGRLALAQYADPRVVGATYEATVRNRYGEDTVANAAQRLVVGGLIDVQHPSAGVSPGPLRLLELRADERALSPIGAVRLPSVTLVLGRAPVMLTDQTA